MPDSFNSTIKYRASLHGFDAPNVAHVHIGLTLRVGSSVSQIITSATC